MIYRNVSLPIFSRIGEGLLNRLSEIIKEENFYFKKVAVLTGNHGKDLVEYYDLKKHFYYMLIFNIRNIKNISYIKSEIISQRVELILSIGGGEVNDLSKYISMETSIPLISIPTTLSNDGISSPISIIKLNGKSYNSIGTTPPIGIISDIKVLINSPKKFLLSGLGDLVSNLSAVLDWELADREVGEKIDIFAKDISLNSVIRILYNFKSNKYKDVVQQEFLVDLFDGLVNSGISMIIARSSRPASGAEHNISHALDRLGSKNLHGVQVGFATLFTLYLHEKYNLINDVLSLYKALKFPLSFRELNIEKDDFHNALKLAPYIRDRYTILNKFSTEELSKKFSSFLEEYILCKK